MKAWPRAAAPMLCFPLPLADRWLQLAGQWPLASLLPAHSCPGSTLWGHPAPHGDRSPNVCPAPEQKEGQAVWAMATTLILGSWVPVPTRPSRIQGDWVMGPGVALLLCALLVPTGSVQDAHRIHSFIHHVPPHARLF